MKRFYCEVTAEPAAGGHRILLDGRPLQTPGKRPLMVPSARLAAAIAEEWRRQETKIQPETMALTRLASTVVDRMPAERATRIAEIAAHAGTDLLCHRADQPAALAERQVVDWQPWLDWVKATHGVGLVVTTGIMPVSQPPAALARLQGVVEGLGDWPLVGLHAATTTLASVVLGLALLAGRLEAEQAVQASLLDELYELERWGADEAALARHAAVRDDVLAAERFLGTLTTNGAAAA